MEPRRRGGPRRSRRRRRRGLLPPLKDLEELALPSLDLEEEVSRRFRARERPEPRRVDASVRLEDRRGGGGRREEERGCVVVVSERKERERLEEFSCPMLLTNSLCLLNWPRALSLTSHSLSSGSLSGTKGTSLIALEERQKGLLPLLLLMLLPRGKGERGAR